jgi:hypothetical protein
VTRDGYGVVFGQCWQLDVLHKIHAVGEDEDDSMSTMILRKEASDAGNHVQPRMNV